MATWTKPTPGDIIWCHFPNLPKSTPGPKPRPALVCHVSEREDGVNVTVAYGTSQGVTQLHAGEFAITSQADPAAYATAGLSYDTKFDLRQSTELPWNGTFFDVPPLAPHGQNPKLGSLHASMMRKLGAAYAAIAGDDS
jgi:hypothetical protein